MNFDRDDKELHIDNDLSLNFNNIKLNKESSGGYNSQFDNEKEYLISDDELEMPSNNLNNSDNNSSNNTIISNRFDQPEKTFEQIQTEKAYYLSEIDRLDKLGQPMLRRLGMESSLDEISNEYFRMKQKYDSQVGIKLCRQFLVCGVSLLEAADNNYNIVGDLDGFGNHTQQNIETYDDVFVDLYNKYKDSMKVSPEIKFVMTFGMSLGAFKMNKQFQRSAIEQQKQSLNETLNKMKGPSMNTKDALDKLGLNDDSSIDLDNMSDISSLSSNKGGDSLPNFSEITINSEPVKTTTKRGRKPKNAATKK